MSTPEDDDALRWEGDEESTSQSVSTGTHVTPAALPDGFTAVGRGSDEVGRIEADGTVTAPHEAGPPSNAMLVTLGVLGGVYALFTIGWIIGGLRLQGVSAFLVGAEAFVPFLWLAIAAPALWFTVTLAVTRRSATWLRVVWLVAGIVVLVPWPFVMMGALGR